MNRKPRIIAVTMGDPAGIGPELCLRALAEPPVNDSARLAVIGDASILCRVAAACSLPMVEQVICRDDWRAGKVPEGGFAIDCPTPGLEEMAPGHVSEHCGRAAYAYIEMAIVETIAGRCAAVVTGPINKEALCLAGVPHPGHTEIFTALTGAPRSCMLLTAPEISATFVTAHVGIREVPDLLSVEHIFDVIKLTHEALARLLGRRPLLAVCGLNPHAGEHGLFGQEETLFIEPAIDRARSEGIQAVGPLPPDAAFLPARLCETDGFVCMYHDQGPVPFKMIAFDTGVNVTLGLPIIRTSVDHGTAFDVAWTGRARVTSLNEAIRCAIRLAAG